MMEYDPAFPTDEPEEEPTKVNVNAIPLPNLNHKKVKKKRHTSNLNIPLPSDSEISKPLPPSPPESTSPSIPHSTPAASENVTDTTTSKSDLLSEPLEVSTPTSAAGPSIKLPTSRISMTVTKRSKVLSLPVGLLNKKSDNVPPAHHQEPKREIFLPGKNDEDELAKTAPISTSITNTIPALMNLDIKQPGKQTAAQANMESLLQMTHIPQKLRSAHMISQPLVSNQQILQLEQSGVLADVAAENISKSGKSRSKSVEKRSRSRSRGKSRRSQSRDKKKRGSSKTRRRSGSRSKRSRSRSRKRNSRSKRRTRSRSKQRKSNRSRSKRRSRSRSRKNSKHNGSKSRKKSRSRSKKRSSSPKHSRYRKKSHSPVSRKLSKSPNSKTKAKIPDKHSGSKSTKNEPEKSKVSKDKNNSSKHKSDKPVEHDKRKSLNKEANSKSKSKSANNVPEIPDPKIVDETDECQKTNIKSEFNEVPTLTAGVNEATSNNDAKSELQITNIASKADICETGSLKSAPIDDSLDLPKGDDLLLNSSDAHSLENKMSSSIRVIESSQEQSDVAIEQVASENEDATQTKSHNDVKVSSEMLEVNPDAEKGDEEKPKEPLVADNEKILIKNALTCKKHYRRQVHSESDDSSDSQYKIPVRSPTKLSSRENVTGKNRSQDSGTDKNNKSKNNEGSHEKSKDTTRKNNYRSIDSLDSSLKSDSKKSGKCKSKSPRSCEKQKVLSSKSDATKELKSQHGHKLRPTEQHKDNNLSPSTKSKSKSKVKRSGSPSVSKRNLKSDKQNSEHQRKIAKSPRKKSHSRSLSPSPKRISRPNNIRQTRRSRSISKSPISKRKQKNNERKSNLEEKAHRRKHISPSKSPKRSRKFSRNRSISKSPKRKSLRQSIKDVRKSKSLSKSPKRQRHRKKSRSVSKSFKPDKLKSRSRKETLSRSTSPVRTAKGRSASPKKKSKTRSRSNSLPQHKIQRKVKSRSVSPEQKDKIKHSPARRRRNSSKSPNQRNISKKRRIQSPSRNFRSRSSSRENRRTSPNRSRRIRVRSRGSSSSRKSGELRKSDTRGRHIRSDSIEHNENKKPSPTASPRKSRLRHSSGNFKSCRRHRESSSSEKERKPKSKFRRSRSQSPAKCAFKTRKFMSSTSTSTSEYSSSTSRSISHDQKEATPKAVMNDSLLNSSNLTITSHSNIPAIQTTQPIVTCQVQPTVSQTYYGTYQWNITPQATNMLGTNMYSAWPTQSPMSSYSMPYSGVQPNVMQTNFQSAVPMLPGYLPPAGYSQACAPPYQAPTHAVQTAAYVQPPQSVTYYQQGTLNESWPLSYPEISTTTAEMSHLNIKSDVSLSYDSADPLLSNQSSQSPHCDEMDIDDTDDEDDDEQQYGDAEELDDAAEGGSELEVNLGDEDHASLRVDDLSGDECDTEEVPVTEEKKIPEDPFNVDPSVPKPQYAHIDGNEYAFRSTKGKNRNKLETTKWVCHCVVPNPDEAASGKRACGDECINRALNIECCSKCPAFELCTNRQFQEMQYAPAIPFYAGPNKGWGMIATHDILPGTFIIEYVGEVVDFREFKRRVNQYEKAGHGHHYFMALESETFIDAGTKGNWARFVNHSCEPNAETQKWNVLGKIRIGFFAKELIKRGSEITIDYQFAQFGRTEQKCYCGTPSCKGIMGATSKQLQEKVRTKDTRVVERRISRLLNLSSLEKSEDVHLLLQVLVQECLLRNTRYALLELLTKTKNESCLKQFLQYNGLELIAAYMKDSDPKDWQIKKHLLLCLQLLPVAEQKPLKTGSSLYNIVTQWSIDPQFCRHRPTVNNVDGQQTGDSVEEANVSVEGSSISDRRASSSLSNDIEDDVESNASSGMVDNETGEKQSFETAAGQEDPSDPLIKEEVKKLAKELLEAWKQLPEEIFRIPKMERQCSEKSQTIEPESDCRSVLSGHQGSNISWGFKTKSVSSAGKSSGHKSGNQTNIDVSKRIPREEYRRLFEMYVRMEEEKKAKEAAEAEEKNKQSQDQTQDTSLALEELKKLDPGSTEALEKMQKLLCQTLIIAIEKLQSGQSPGETGLPPELYGLVQHPDINKLYEQLNRSDTSQLMNIIGGGRRNDDINQLPPNWKWVRNSDSRIYYYHTVTKRTQWETPVYPWDAGEDDVNSYDFNNASNYQVSHEEIDEMYKRLKAAFKRKQKLAKMKKKKKKKEKERKSAKPELKKKRMFAKEIYLIAMNILKPYRDPDCKVGRIKSDTDLKYLSKKLCQTILMKELKLIRHIDDLEVNTNVRSKAQSYIETYITSRGPVYIRHSKTSHNPETTESNSLPQKSTSPFTADDVDNSPLLEFSP